MKKFLSVLAALILLLPASLSAQTAGDGNDIFKPIARYLGNGDTAHLSAWMAPTVDISVVSSLNIASRAHAIRILDEDGRDVPDGTAGELCYENPFVRGYKNLPEKTAEA